LLPKSSWNSWKGESSGKIKKYRDTWGICGGYGLDVVNSKDQEFMN